MQKLSLLPENAPFSRIIAGCMNWGSWGANLSIKNAHDLITQLIDLDITTFDHADIYGHYSTEELFGSALQKTPSLRSKIQLITKCGIQLITPVRPYNTIKFYDTTKAYIINSVEQSLKKLHTDYIDLLLIHRPSPLMHPEDIADAFETLKKQGKVVSFGVSNFTTTQFDMLNHFFPLLTNQVEISPLHLSPFLDGTLDQCLKHKIHPMGYSTLAGGKFFSNPNDPKVSRIMKVVDVLKETYKSSADAILISWILKHPSGILPIIGSTKIKRLQVAINAFNINLTDQEWFMIWQASSGDEVA